MERLEQAKISGTKIDGRRRHYLEALKVKLNWSDPRNAAFKERQPAFQYWVPVRDPDQVDLARSANVTIKTTVKA